jgi:hypothetical protein
MTIQQEHRAKRQELGLESLREQMDTLARDNEATAQTREIEQYKTVRKTLRPAELETLIEFKHAGSPGTTNKGLAIITRYSESTIDSAVAKLRRIDAIKPTGFATDRPRRNRISREGVNILQAR